MKNPKVTVKYDHDSADLNPIFLALVTTRNKKKVWIPAYRDVVSGERVVWIRASPSAVFSEVWVRDKAGERKVPQDHRR